MRLYDKQFDWRRCRKCGGVCKVTALDGRLFCYNCYVYNTPRRKVASDDRWRVSRRYFTPTGKLRSWARGEVLYD